MKRSERNKLITVVTRLKKEGLGNGEVAVELNKLGHKTGRGNKWNAVAVNNFIQRARVNGRRIPRERASRKGIGTTRKTPLPAIRAILDLDLPAEERVALAQLVLGQ